MHLSITTYLLNMSTYFNRAFAADTPVAEEQHVWKATINWGEYKKSTRRNMNDNNKSIKYFVFNVRT